MHPDSTDIDQRIKTTKRRRKVFKIIFFPILMVVMIVSIIIYPVFPSVFDANKWLFFLLVTPLLGSLISISFTNYYWDHYLQKLYEISLDDQKHLAESNPLRRKLKLAYACSIIFLIAIVLLFFSLIYL